MKKALYSKLAVVLMIVGGAFFYGNEAVIAQSCPPEPPAIHAGHNHEFHPGGMRAAKEDMEQLLKLLKIDENTFHDYIANGYSLQEIAKQQNVKVKDVIDLVEAQIIKHARLQAEEFVNHKPLRAPGHRPQN